uniref:Uncharacterized protein n=1 Tax=Nelumbo nucifera TaxID=4432 RepID=A0A822ZN25_NELNU|nr:TPA_asm: hypothetical protein HUJ06_004110 [Nelumbo nucifera]
MVVGAVEGYEWVARAMDGGGSAK